MSLMSICVLDTRFLSKFEINHQIKAEADAQATTTSGDSNDLRAANQRIAELEKSLEKSRREIEKINRNWEKRFRILRTSMHEIKNESFVRRRLEYQPMALHTAKMNYRAEFTSKVSNLLLLRN